MGLSVEYLLVVEVMVDEPRRISWSQKVAPRLLSKSFVAAVSDPVPVFIRRGCILPCPGNLEGAWSFLKYGEEDLEQMQDEEVVLSGSDM